MEKKGQEFLGIKDVIRRVEAAKARERQARLERVVVDDFVKRR